jgi:hypothetical protein
MTCSRATFNFYGDDVIKQVAACLSSTRFQKQSPPIIAPPPFLCPLRSINACGSLSVLLFCILLNFCSLLFHATGRTLSGVDKTNQFELQMLRLRLASITDNVWPQYSGSGSISSESVNLVSNAKCPLGYKTSGKILSPVLVYTLGLTFIAWRSFERVLKT